MVTNLSQFTEDFLAFSPKVPYPRILLNLRKMGKVGHLIIRVHKLVNL